MPHIKELVGITAIISPQLLHPENGLDPQQLTRSVILHPSILITDQRIPDLCQLPYLRPDRRNLGCGGIRHQRSACPPYAPSSAETRETLDKAKAVVLIQATGLTEYDDQKRLHVTLMAIEEHLADFGFNVTAS